MHLVGNFQIDWKESERILKDVTEIRDVSSGEEAIDYLEQNSVDLVLLDMLMEPGINGRQTYECLIKINPDQRAIIASGFSESEDVNKTIQFGVWGFIKKPYSMDQLDKIVKEALI